MTNLLIVSICSVIAALIIGFKIGYSAGWDKAMGEAIQAVQRFEGNKVDDLLKAEEEK